MSRILVLVAGWINAALVVFHLRLAWDLRTVASIPGDSQALMEMLNVATAILVALLAVASIATTNELLTSRLGKFVLFAAIAMYATRAVEEVILAPEFSTAIFTVCLVVAALYTGAWATRHQIGQTVAAGPLI